MKKLIKLIIAIGIILLIINFVNFKNIKNQILMKFYKIEYEQYVEKYSEEYDVDKYLIFAIIKAESDFKEDAVSNRGAKGLMQLMYSTAVEIGEKINLNVNEENIFDPDININIGTKYISLMMKKYSNINLALASYNAGSGNVDNWINNGTLEIDGSNIENIPYVETNNYVRKILRDYKIYKELYQK